MRRETFGGTAMIVAVFMMIVTMAFHPSGHDIARDPQEQGLLANAVHVLALLSVPLSFYGGWALTRRLAQGGELAALALVFYGIASVGTLLATTHNGLIAPALIARGLTLEGDAKAVADTVLHYDGSVAHASVLILVFASAIAIALWSIAILRDRLMRRVSGVVGCVVALVPFALAASSHLRLDVHGFGALVLAQSVWFVMIGIELRSNTS